ncbi:Histone-like transcription factor (CBF/NF-Y) and archaeal histone [Ceratobasidium sp. AG-Ba]|nr:Histone-like transcription factor (CBF/NF-Y) and archaeal histone [Ceratobasidium sp. AG-Ba]QRW06582.1 Histone-like transcription factor (CBF/NF-Y) and archaeal histone [Ceratobasidium sp. AG-Ba]
METSEQPDVEIVQQPQPQAPPPEAEKAPKPKPAAPELGESLLPIARVQRIMKADKDLPNVTKEAVHTISVATEEFIKRLASEAYHQASRDRRTMVQYKDVALAVKRNPEMHFLEEMIPTAIPAPAALAQHKLKAQDRGSTKTTAASSSTALPSNGRKAPGARAVSSNGKNKASASTGPSAAVSSEGTPDVPDEPNEMDLS